MKEKEINLKVRVFADVQELPESDQELLREARKITDIAYAPYSRFQVGAAARLVNGAVVKGTNQENASYPVGICAERVLLANAAMQFPGVAIECMAISYHNLNGTSNHPISPCGICRQTLAEYEDRTQQAIRLLLTGQDGEVYAVEKAAQLLPLTFTAEDLIQ